MSAPTDNPALARAQDKLALLRNHPLFRELPSTVIDRLGSYMKRRSVARGSTIFAKGDPGDALMGVLAGTVKISVPSADGRDVVLNIINEGGIFGEIALLDGHPRTADAIAMSECQLMIIERRDFVQFLRSQPDVALKFIEILCARLRRTSEQVQDVTFLDLPTRLAKTLLRLTAERCPDAKAQGLHHAAGAQPDDRHVAREHEQAAARLGEAQMDRARTGRRDCVAAGPAGGGRRRGLGLRST